MHDNRCVTFRSLELELRPLWELYGITMSYGSSLVVQRLVLGPFTAMDPGSIPGQGTKIPQATWDGQKKKMID